MSSEARCGIMKGLIAKTFNIRNCQGIYLPWLSMERSASIHRRLDYGVAGWTISRHTIAKRHSGKSALCGGRPHFTGELCNSAVPAGDS